MHKPDRILLDWTVGTLIALALAGWAVSPLAVAWGGVVAAVFFAIARLIGIWPRFEKPDLVIVYAACGVAIGSIAVFWGYGMAKIAAVGVVSFFVANIGGLWGTRPTRRRKERTNTEVGRT